ncbi:unnamed protein product [Ectocarpus fasciculatus]
MQSKKANIQGKTETGALPWAANNIKVVHFIDHASLSTPLRSLVLLAQNLSRQSISHDTDILVLAEGRTTQEFETLHRHENEKKEKRIAVGARRCIAAVVLSPRRQEKNHPLDVKPIRTRYFVTSIVCIAPNRRIAHIPVPIWRNEKQARFTSNEITTDKLEPHTEHRENPARTTRTHTVGVRQDADRLNIPTPIEPHIPRGGSPHS